MAPPEDGQPPPLDYYLMANAHHWLPIRSIVGSLVSTRVVVLLRCTLWGGISFACLYCSMNLHIRSCKNGICFRCYAVFFFFNAVEMEAKLNAHYSDWLLALLEFSSFFFFFTCDICTRNRSPTYLDPILWTAAWHQMRSMASYGNSRTTFSPNTPQSTV